MMKVFARDIKERQEFNFDEDMLKAVGCLDEEKHIWLYRRLSHNGRLMGYELVMGIKHTNPDGNIVYAYPSNEKFGTYGYFISAQWADKDIPKYLLYLKYGRKEGEKKWLDFLTGGHHIYAGLDLKCLTGIIPHLDNFIV